MAQEGASSENLKPQAPTTENENSNTVSVNLLSQALGPVMGVLVPREQNYSSQKVFTEILGPLNSFKFHSLEKAGCDIITGPFPVEVRDSSDNTLFRFFGRQMGQQIISTPTEYGYNTHHSHIIYMAVLVDSQQRELLYAKPLLEADPDYTLSCKEGAGEQSLGKVAVPGSFTCDARYNVTAMNLFTNHSIGLLMEAQATSSNCCCSTSETLLFGCPNLNSNSRSGNFKGSSDPRVVGELKRLTTLISKNPNGASEVTFDQKLPIVHKIWILFICYHHHYRNFANTACSRNGQRGLCCSVLNIVIWTLVVVLVVLPLFLVIVLKLIVK